MSDAVSDLVQDHASRLARAERRWLLDARARLRTSAVRPAPVSADRPGTSEGAR